MPYEIILSPEAAEDLGQLKANVRAAIRAALTTYLRYEPTSVSKSRIKRLRSLCHPQYRLRVDDIRVFYDVSETNVEVLAIIDKAEANVWLAQFGEPEEEMGDETDTAFGSQE